MTVVGERQAVIAGLRRLADWLERNPEVPVANEVEMHPHVPIYEDEAGVAEIRRLAEVAGAVFRDRGDRVEACAEFGGGVAWRVLYVSREAMSRHLAWSSYSDSVQPEEVSA